MKLNGTSSNTPPTSQPTTGSHQSGHAPGSHQTDATDVSAWEVDELVDEIGDAHGTSSIDTPMRADAFAMDDDLKIDLIEEHFREIMGILGLDLTDDSLKGSPRRVAKMYVNEIFSGLNPANKPKPTLFDNKFRYLSLIHI